MQTAALSLFEISSAQLRLNEDLQGMIQKESPKSVT